MDVYLEEQARQMSLTARSAAMPNAEPPVVHLLPHATGSRRVLMALAELGCKEGSDFRIEAVSTAGQVEATANLKRQPPGKIPAWQEGDWVLVESSAICEYLCARFPGSAASQLLPPPGRARAEVQRWVSVEATELRPRVLNLLKQMKGPDETVVGQARTDVTVTLDLLDVHLAIWHSYHTYLAGDSFTLADLGFMPYLEKLCEVRCADLIESRPSLHAWWVRCRTRPTWQATLGMAKEAPPSV